MVLAQLFRRSPHKDEAHALYTAAVRQARQPAFYAECSVPDTVDGRFDLIVLHVFLTLRRLRRAGEPGERCGKTMVEVLVDDMDQNLREMGVGDLSVGKKVKVMMQAFMGRSKAYDDALASGADPSALAAALQRNVYGRDVPKARQLAALAGYVRDADAALGAQPFDEFWAGRPAFPPAPSLGPSQADD